jgi:hypothetical protein
MVKKKFSRCFLTSSHTWRGNTAWYVVYRARLDKDEVIQFERKAYLKRPYNLAVIYRVRLASRKNNNERLKMIEKSLFEMTKKKSIQKESIPEEVIQHTYRIPSKASLKKIIVLKSYFTE